MPEDHVGLFNTPPTRAQVRISLATVGVLFVALAIVFVIPNVRLREVSAVVPMVDAIMIMGDLITATLLYVTASVFRSRALTVLASTFVFIALLLVTHMLTFPGAFAPTGLLGAGVNTTGWLFILRRASLPIAIIAYVLIRRSETSVPAWVQLPDPGVAVGLATAVMLAVVVSVIATAGHDLLPPLFVDRTHVIRTALITTNLVLIPLVLVAMASLFWKRVSVLDMWLLVASAAWIIQLPVNLRDWGRFTVGFYAQFAMMPASNLILMLALLTESSRLHMRLALAQAARKRERDALLTSVDAIAATFSHEIGQPLTAVTTNAKAGLNYLTRAKPNVGKAIEALRASLDAGKLTVSVIKSLRAMAARQPAGFNSFALNDVVRETADLLHRELASAKVTLELDLEDALPPAQADRVQVQQVLVNLVMNAIESMNGARDMPRCVTLRSSRLDGRGMLLEVSDTGHGIAAGDLERIFEPFVTTKADGSGLGLAISRILAEEQGGRLWAAPNNGRCGATFCLQLPCIGAEAP